MKMRKLITIIILASGFAASGCAMSPKDSISSSAKRKAALTSCVSRFLGEDVAPVDSLHICSSIYSRWQPTTTGSVSGEVGARKR